MLGGKHVLIPARKSGQAKSEGALAKGPFLDDVRAVFFDAVGTLIFPAEPVAETYRAIARRHGSDIDKALIDHRFRETFRAEEERDEQAGWRTDEGRERQRWRHIVSSTLREVTDREACLAELWNHFGLPAAWAVNPDAGPLIDELARGGIAIGIASNFDARLLGIVRGLPALAPTAGLCVVSALVGWRKPAPEFFAELSRRANCATAEVILVGDDLRNDYTAACASGLKAILYRAADNSTINDRITSLSDLLTPPAPLPAARDQSA